MASPRCCGGSVDIARRGALDPRSLGVGCCCRRIESCAERLLGSHRLVTIDDVLEALAALDHHPNGPPGEFRAQRCQPRWSGMLIVFRLLPSRRWGCQYLQELLAAGIRNNFAQQCNTVAGNLRRGTRAVLQNGDRGAAAKCQRSGPATGLAGASTLLRPRAHHE